MRRLTPREREVARLVAGGNRAKTIAHMLGVTTGTIKLHTHNIYRKLGVSGRIALMHEWARHEHGVETTQRNDTLREQRDEALKSVNEMSERFRAVNVDAVGQAMGEDIFALRTRCEALEAQVKRLLAKESERIGTALTKETGA